MVTISKEELDSIQTDPIAAIALTLNAIETASNDIIEVDPSNPFMFMLEMVAFNSAVLRDEVNTKHARTYPMLANSESSLYNNMSYKDYKSVFSQPSDAVFRFTVNVTNFTTNALLSPAGDFKMASIPEGTTITAEGYSFLIANRIDIKQFENGLFSIEQNVSSSEVGITSLGVLPHQIIRTDSENSMLIFDTTLKQITVLENEYTIKKSDSFSINIDIEDRLYFISARVISSNIEVPVYVAYSEVIDPTVPTLLVKILSNRLEITVPDVYIINDMVVGKLYISIYTTKGIVDYPLNLLSQDLFILKYNNTTIDDYTSIINKVAVGVNALERLTGGTNGKSFSELRDSIINNTVGNNDKPITNSQLVSALQNDGFYGYLLEDTIVSRTFIASRTLAPNISLSNINANPDLLMYRTKIIPTDYVDHSMVIATFDSSDKLIIKPNTIFKSISGGVVPLSDAEILELNTMSTTNKMVYLNSSKLVFSPYSYISSIEDGVYYLRVVDFTAGINGSTINIINSNVLARINIQTYTISVTDTGYRIVFKMIANSEFSSVDSTKVRAQLELPISSSNSVYFQTEYIDGYFTFDVDTNFYVDTNYMLNITNGTSSLATRFIDLLTIAKLSTYVLDTGNEITNGFYLNDTVLANENIVVFTNESVSITFGKAIDKLYTNMTVSYTDRKYLTYTETIYATYDTDIYDTDSLGSLLTPNPEITEVTYTLLHSKGDIILDELGDPIILHTIGDYILDEDGNPTIDVLNGIIKYLDMFLVEYNYLYTGNSTSNILDSITAYMQDIKEYDGVLLEETRILFKPFRDNAGVRIKLNNTYKTIYSELKPEVTLYVEKITSLTDTDLLLLRNTAGSIIHAYLNRESFYTVDIRDEIKNTIAIDTVAIGVKLDINDDYLVDAEKVVLYDNTSRLSISKYLTNILGNINMVYDVKITIKKT